MIKTFKQFNESPERRNAPDENRFIDKHVFSKKEHPVGKEDQFTSKGKKAKRDADLDNDKEVYEQVVSESVIDDLRSIVKKKSVGQVKFGNGAKTKVDMFTASAMVKVHDALNSANQKKFADAINKDETMFMKMMDFAMSKVK